MSQWKKGERGFLTKQNQSQPSKRLRHGSLPREAEAGQILSYPETGNRYQITRVQGQGLESDDDAASQKELAEADIIRGASVPTIWLRQLGPGTKKKENLSLAQPCSLPAKLNHYAVAGWLFPNLDGDMAYG